MFWGLVVEPHKRYEKTVNTPFYVSQAVLDVDTSGDSNVRLTLKNNDQKYILCVLNKFETVQERLNLMFSKGDVIAFKCVGGTVHLSGYLVPDPERT